MARKTKKQALQVKQDPAAPFLFDEQDLPLREDWVQFVREERYKHTGARLLDNDAKALRLVELLIAGWGLKRISREMQVSTHTVRAARSVLVAQGKLATYKERIVRVFEDIVETGAGRYLEALEDGLVPAAQIPVGVGIISDKRALAIGEPTAIGVVAAAQLDQGALSVKALNAWVESLPAVPTDAQSTGNPTKPEEKAHDSAS
jgi:hypothetical protein